MIRIPLAWIVVSLLVAAPAAAADPPRAERPTLRVAVTPLATIVEWNGKRPTGVAIDIWEDLADRLGVATEFVRTPTFTALLETLPAGEADVALGPMAITEERERMIDLTHPIFHSGLRIAVRQKNESGLLAAVRSLVSWRLLELAGIVVALAIVTGHLLWWFERSGNERSFPAAYPRGVREAVWWIASTVVTGGCDDKHVDSLLGRMLAFAWMVGGIGLIAAFTSVLTAQMTAERVVGVIQGPRDLAGRSVGVQAAGVAVPAVRQRGGFPQEYQSMNDAFDALALGMVDAVVTENHQLLSFVSQSSRGSLKAVGPIFESFDYGFGLPSGSPLRERLNTAILRMREDGTLDTFLEEWVGKHD